MYDFRKRIARLEVKTNLFTKRMLIWIVYRTPLLPDVFNTPLTEWRTYHKGSLVTVDPYREAVERGGDVPFVPVEKYELWRTEQMKLFKATNAEIILFAAPEKAEPERNNTNRDSFETEMS
jgi:hypothetical protein